MAHLKETKCKCGHIIAFIKLDSGKTMPVEAAAINFVVLGEDEIGRIMSGYMPHWGQCKFARDFNSGVRGMKR